MSLFVITKRPSNACGDVSRVLCLRNRGSTSSWWRQQSSLSSSSSLSDLCATRRPLHSRIIIPQENYAPSLLPQQRVNPPPRRFLSTTPSFDREHVESSNDDNGNDDDGPWGDLFESDVGPDLVGKVAKIRRTFDAQSNAMGLLTCGGQALAKHASFDPQYHRARHWIQHHAVGPAILSPVLISGLVGALVEAAVPKAVPMSSTMKQIRPLVVGVEVCAIVEVVSVADPELSAGDDGEEDLSDCTGTAAVLAGPPRQDLYERSNGFEVCLRTQVERVRDGAPIAQGTHSIWIPDYLHM